MVLHRTFEYNADKLSTTLMHDFSPDDAQTGLTFINTEIRKDLFAHLPTSTSSYQHAQNPLLRLLGNGIAMGRRLYTWLYTTIVNAYLGHLHPTPAKRINALKKLVGK